MKSQKMFVFLVALNFCLPGTLFGQYISKYPDIPIVDVHIHAGGESDAANYLKVSEAIKQKHGSNLAFWINMGDPGDAVANQMKAACSNRILFAVSQMRPQKGLTTTPEAVIARVQDGCVGLKFWFGPAYRVLQEGEEGITKIDDPRFEELFASLEKANVLMASLHIADPNGPYGERTDWCKDPIYYWEQIRAFEKVVAKYPDLTIVAAHGVWLVCQDAQIDYLRYMFSTYPNLYADISATFQYMPLVKRENLRDFYIEYQDRLLYGSDWGRINDSGINWFTDQYAKTFAILETDQLIEGGFFGNKSMQGLDLPREVLEKIYYKNALKLYPGLKEAMGQ